MLENDELLGAFVEESFQHLQNIEPDLLGLEQNRDAVDSDTINRIFRGIHSIKGASGFFGLQNIGKLSHVMESTLVLLRDGKLSPTPKLIDALLSGVDALKVMLEDIGASENLNIRHELSYLQNLIDGTAGAGKTVAVSQKREKQNDSPLSKFHVSESEIGSVVSENLNLYAIKILLNEDIRQKGKTPFDFINQMERAGRYIDSFLNVSGVTGLSDCLDNDLAFDFLFATVLKPEHIPGAVDIPKSRISVIDLDEYRKNDEARDEPPPEASQPLKAVVQEIKRPNDKLAVEIPSKESEPEERSIKGVDKTIRHVHTDEKIRVSVSFLNELVNLAGELVLGRNQMMQTAMPLIKHAPGLNPVLQHISRVTSEMQEKIMQMRMQPIAIILDKFHRVVRDSARNLKKDVRLITYGDDVELDKSIIEGLSDPLTHLVRNAVDHGIESPEEREKLGKHRQGLIEFRAFHQGGQVFIKVRDDGRGIDGQSVGRKAMEKGILRPEQFNTMTEKELVRLVFRPGFSTAEKVTDISGRGVGMDVVVTNIEQLGGTVDIVTKVNKHTTVTLALPLTLAIISGLLIQSADQNFILPEADIDELVRIKPDEIGKRIDIVQKAHVLRLRDSLLPLVDLNRVIGLSQNGSDRFSVETTEPLRVLVVKYGASRFGLIVDNIVNTEEIVVKSLPRYLKKMKCFSGVTILGNGKVSLILDVAGIVKKANIRAAESAKEDLKAEMEEKWMQKETQTFLLFDNHTPEQFALPLEQISRIERVPVSRIETIKDKRFIQYHNKKIRLIYLEDYLPVTRPERADNDMIGIIIPKLVKHPMGIVIDRVINTIDARIDLDTSTIMAPGLFGSAVIDQKITLLPDMYRLFELADPERFENRNTRDAETGKYRVLLAEDTPFFRMVESEYLISAGYDVTVAENGQKALEILEEKPFDAVILDIVMPKKDGWAVIKAIRSDERLKDLPVMALTSLGVEGDKEIVQKGIKEGFDGWEVKLDKTRLLEKLSQLLDR